MQQGNEGSALQILEEPRVEKRDSAYSKNLELIIKAQSGGDESACAMEELVILNKGLVRSVSSRFRDRGMEMEDIIQIGTLGLIKAVRSFDVNRGTAFSTYAVPMIFGEIRKTLRDDGLIKVGRYYKTLGDRKSVV